MRRLASGHTAGRKQSWVCAQGFPGGCSGPVSKGRSCSKGQDWHQGGRGWEKAPSQDPHTSEVTPDSRSEGCLAP